MKPRATIEETCKGYWPDMGTPCLRRLWWEPWAGKHACPKEGDPDHIDYTPMPETEVVAEITTFADPEPRYLERCLHRDKIPVESIIEPEVILAYICKRCDAQLEAPPWSPYYSHRHEGAHL